VSALAVTWLCEWIAIAGRSRPIALLALAVYGFGFLVLGVARPSLAIVALVVALPLVTIELGFGDVEKTVSGDKIAVIIVGGLWLVQRGGQSARSLFRHAAIRWWLLLLLVITLSVIAHGASKSEMWGLTGALVYGAIFASALDLFDRDARALRLVLTAAALTAGAVAGLGLVEKLVLSKASLYFKDGVMAYHYSFGSTIGQSNFLAAYLALSLGPLSGLVCLRATPRRACFVASGVAGVLALVLARSIGALAGVAAGALVVLIIGLRRTRSRRIRAALVVVVILAAGATAVIGARKLRVDPIPFTHRAALLRLGLAAVRERPWVGFGTNAFTRISDGFAPELFGGHEAGHPVHRAPSAHNAYLNLAVERGLGALIAFLGLLASVVWCGVRRPATHGAEWEVIVLGLLGAIVAYLAQAATENLFSSSKVTTMFWIMAAALVSAGAPRGTHTSR